jgi:uncharacterized protein (DUF58 family)
MSAFLFLLILMLVLAFFFRVDFIFFVIYVCVGVYLWNRWQTPRSVASLRSARRYNKRAFWGEDVSVELMVHNPRLLPLPWLRVQESIAVELRKGEGVNHVIALPGREKVTLTYDVTARRRGYYRLGPLRLVSGDLFGMLPSVTAILPTEYLTVYPRITPLARLGLPSKAAVRHRAEPAAPVRGPGATDGGARFSFW